MIRAIVGANWGDEGKGKITDSFAAESDMIIRYQGGSNAGHTIINEHGKFALHQMPSGVFYEHTMNIIGNGVALNIPYLLKEIESFEEKCGRRPNLMISDRVQVVLSYHILFDTYEEERLADKKFGSTKSGIAPFYADKYAKKGIQINELYDDEKLYEKLKDICEVKNITLKHLYKKPEITPEEVLEEIKVYREAIKPYIGDTFHYVNDATKAGKHILLEGQLGALKDPDHGIFPYTTSSSTLAGFASVGAGIAPGKIDKVVAVVKAYSSAVGEGPFVSEIFGEEATEMRKRGGDDGEFGATTGRPRRMGWFDIVASKYGCEVQGATDIALTVIDALGYLKEIPVCVAYEIEGIVIDRFPATYLLEKAKPVLEVLPGWNCDLRGIKSWEELPKNAKNYIKFIEEKIGIPVTIVSNGPKREEYFEIK